MTIDIPIWIMAAVLTSLAVIAMAVAVRWLEPKMTFLPIRGEEQSPAAWGVGYEDLWVSTADGWKLHGWRLQRTDAAARIVFFHGNRGNLTFWSSFLVSIWRQGYEVVAFDYRGYGLSQGSPTEEGLLEDCRAVVGYLKKELPSDLTVFWGRSLGGLTSAFSASLAQPEGLILEATFPDKKTLLRTRAPFLRLLAVFSRYRLATRLWLQEYSSPVLVLHGDADQVVPIPVGRELLKFIRGPQRFFRVKGGGHGDIQDVSPNEYWAVVNRFIEDLKHGFNQHQRDFLPGDAGSQKEGEEAAPARHG